MTGKARFTYEGQLHDEAVFKAMLGLPATHEKKMFKISLEDFHDKEGRSARGECSLQHPLPDRLGRQYSVDARG